jgi:hypothetical protein
MGTALCFLDVRKAYDRVWRAGLFLKLSQLGIGGRFLAMLRIMFRRVSRTILVNDSFTEEFDVHTGVPQGSVLSPLLYAVYVNGLHDALRDHGLGVRIYGRLVLSCCTQMILFSWPAMQWNSSVCCVLSLITLTSGALK